MSFPELKAKSYCPDEPEDFFYREEEVKEWAKALAERIGCLDTNKWGEDCYKILCRNCEIKKELLRVSKL